MNNHIANLILQLALEVRQQPTIPKKVSNIVYELQRFAKLENSDKSQSTRSPLSSNSMNRHKQGVQIQIVPFQLSPVDKMSKSPEIKIEDDLFCNESEEEAEIEKRSKKRQNMNKEFKIDLTPIQQLPQQQNQETKRKSHYYHHYQHQGQHKGVVHLKPVPKRYNYLAMAQGSFCYTAI